MISPCLEFTNPTFQTQDDSAVQYDIAYATVRTAYSLCWPISHVVASHSLCLPVSRCICQSLTVLASNCVCQSLIVLVSHSLCWSVTYCVGHCVGQSLIVLVGHSLCLSVTHYVDQSLIVLVSHSLCWLVTPTALVRHCIGQLGIVLVSHCMHQSFCLSWSLQYMSSMYISIIHSVIVLVSSPCNWLPKANSAPLVSPQILYPFVFILVPTFWLASCLCFSRSNTTC